MPASYPVTFNITVSQVPLGIVTLPKLVIGTVRGVVSGTGGGGDAWKLVKFAGGKPLGSVGSLAAFFKEEEETTPTGGAAVAGFAGVAMGPWKKGIAETIKIAAMHKTMYRRNLCFNKSPLVF